MRSSLMRFAQEFCLAVGYDTLAYASGTVAYDELYEQWGSWNFERQIATIELTKAAADERLRMQAQQGASINRAVAGSVDLSEGDDIGKRPAAHPLSRS
jgi:hypothetical protein